MNSGFQNKSLHTSMALEFSVVFFFFFTFLKPLTVSKTNNNSNRSCNSSSSRMLGFCSAVQNRINVIFFFWFFAHFGRIDYFILCRLEILRVPIYFLVNVKPGARQVDIAHYTTMSYYARVHSAGYSIGCIGGFF